MSAAIGMTSVGRSRVAEHPRLRRPSSQEESGPSSHELTIAVSTSASRLPPAEQTAHLCAALQSLHEFAPCCRKLLIFDALPTPSDVQTLCDEDRTKWSDAWRRDEAYREYTAAVQTEVAQRWPLVEMVQLPRFGHLTGSVRAALDAATTPWLLLTQHDLVLDAAIIGGAWPGIREALQSGAARYVVCGRDAHASVRSQSHWHFEPSLDCAFGGCCRATSVVGFSDQTHFVDASWYRRSVLDRIPPQRRTCMEHVVHEAMREAWAAGGDHERTFALGAAEDLPTVRDLVHGQVDANDAWLGAPHEESEWRKFYVDGGEDGSTLRRMRAQLDLT